MGKEQDLTTYERVRRVFVEEIGVDAADVSPLTPRLQADIDSLEMANLILELEDEFGIEITDDDLKNIFTPQDIVKYVDSLCHAN